jgi:D-alanyl-D-alanine carboxypeptidase-like protein
VPARQPGSGRMVRARLVALLAVAALVAACGGGEGGDEGEAGAETDGSTTTARPTTTEEPTTAPPTTAPAAAERPDWLGTRVLTTVPGQDPPPTPPELNPRDLVTVDRLPPPADGRFHASVEPVPDDVVVRSTWHADCPVALADLRYVQVSFWGFDDTPHTGEMIVHRTVAEPMTGVFRAMFEDRFPIEDMHVTTKAELDAADTGDGNPTAAFVCRPTRGATSWSQHAYGLAVDVNPFHNPYHRNGRLLPGLASTYLDRADERPGMVVPGGVVAEGFAGLGWHWAGTWDEPDFMHFSSDGT